MGWLKKPADVGDPAVPEPDVTVEAEPVVFFEPWQNYVEPPAPPAPTWPDGVYVGRLHCDGEGNLCASEGDWAGFGVYHDLEAGAYLFVPDGAKSHNQRHHRNTVPLDMTRAATNERPADPHHDRPTEDDAHFDPTGGTFVDGKGWNFTRSKLDPDEVAPLLSGHTDAYTKGAA